MADASEIFENLSRSLTRTADKVAKKTCVHTEIL